MALLTKRSLLPPQQGIPELFRGFRTNIIKNVLPSYSGFEAESEMIVNMKKTNLKYKEIPISTIYLDKFKGTSILTGFKIISKAIWWRVFS